MLDNSSETLQGYFFICVIYYYMIMPSVYTQVLKPLPISSFYIGFILEVHHG